MTLLLTLYVLVAVLYGLAQLYTLRRLQGTTVWHFLRIIPSALLWPVDIVMLAPVLIDVVKAGVRAGREAKQRGLKPTLRVTGTVDEDDWTEAEIQVGSRCQRCDSEPCVCDARRTR